MKEAILSREHWIFQALLNKENRKKATAEEERLQFKYIVGQGFCKSTFTVTKNIKNQTMGYGKNILNICNIKKLSKNK